MTSASEGLMSDNAVDPPPPAPRLSGDFWRFWIGQTISNLGSAFTRFALPLLGFQLTGSALNPALASAAPALPGLLFGLLIGVRAHDIVGMLDRIDMR